MQRNTVCLLEEYLISKHTVFQSGEACIFGRTSKTQFNSQEYSLFRIFHSFFGNEVQQNDVEGMNISSNAYPSLE